MHARTLAPTSVLVHPRTHAHWVKVGPLAPFALSLRPSTRSPRCRCFCRAVTEVHARAWGKGEAFRVTHVIPPPSKSVPLDAASRDPLVSFRCRERQPEHRHG
jgi:hypothetical protein